ncbi:MAG: hypothetical protein HYZ74_03260, partial [Elusimicrobia bacterium]|nr:hypothetical protein [Elusimicrobiota bacterium]
MRRLWLACVLVPWTVGQAQAGGRAVLEVDLAALPLKSPTPIEINAPAANGPAFLWGPPTLAPTPIPITFPPAAPGPDAASPAPVATVAERPKTIPIKLPTVMKDSSGLNQFFDGTSSDIRGTYIGNPLTASADAQPALPHELAAQLRHVSRLPGNTFQALLRRLASSPPSVRGPPAFSDKNTFSFELEFVVNEQIRDNDLRLLFSGKTRFFSQNKPLSTKEWDQWHFNRQLRPERWEPAWRMVVSNVRELMPRGWSLTSDSTGKGRNTLEINTGNIDGLEYHHNTPDDWANLIADLDRVQEGLPGGLYSVHLHSGRSDLIVDKHLAVDGGLFARMVKVFESNWRVLSGLGYRRPRGDQVSFLSHWSLDPNIGSSSVRDHGKMLNLHYLFPTIENRILSGLLRRRPDGTQYLDSSRLAADTWWMFSLLNRAAEGNLPLAALGVPVAAGAKPSSSQIAGFADAVFGQDLIGKALALARFAAHVDDMPSM